MACMRILPDGQHPSAASASRTAMNARLPFPHFVGGGIRCGKRCGASSLPRERSEQRGGWPASGRSGGGIQGMHDAFHHTVQIPIHVRIPEPQDVKSPRAEERVAFAVRSHTRLDTVLATIYLDDQSCAERDKVDDVAADRCLPPKMKSERLQFAQLDPYFDFLRREAFAKRAGILICQKPSPLREPPPDRPLGRPPRERAPLASDPALRGRGIRCAMPGAPQKNALP